MDDAKAIAPHAPVDQAQAQASANVATAVNAPTDDDGTPLSVRIRERVVASGGQYFANDNIADHIREGEIDLLQKEVEDKMRGVLESLVIDIENDHNTQDTARRVAKMFIREVFSGRYQAPPPVTEFPNAAKLNELMIVGPITMRSACAHHLCPIMGKVWVGVMPNEHSNLIGLSKYARLIDWVMSRPQIQEEAVAQLADLLQDKLQPVENGQQRDARFLPARFGAASRIPVFVGEYRQITSTCFPA